MKKHSFTMSLGEPEELMRLTPGELTKFLERRQGEMIRSREPFTDYMRMKFCDKDILQQQVFLAADIPERYGYKLIAGEKHTVRRDTILCLCLAARFTLEETQEALILYGMAPLYWRIPRDAAFIVAFSNRIWDVDEMDELLMDNGLAPIPL
ncbi:MAG: hypothetical protein II845_03390 [Oscillospiraceae bacterium]|nr:hypothetical protein [Oscillospiraceae bacterium]